MKHLKSLDFSLKAMSLVCKIQIYSRYNASEGLNKSYEL